MQKVWAIGMNDTFLLKSFIDYGAIGLLVIWFIVHTRALNRQMESTNEGFRSDIRSICSTHETNIKDLWTKAETERKDLCRQNERHWDEIIRTVAETTRQLIEQKGTLEGIFSRIKDRALNGNGKHNGNGGVKC